MNLAHLSNRLLLARSFLKIATNTDIDASLLLIKIKSNNLKTKKNGKNSSRMVNKPNE
jgi:hypothetical protein